MLSGYNRHTVAASTEGRKKFVNRAAFGFPGGYNSSYPGMGFQSNTSASSMSLAAIGQDILEGLIEYTNPFIMRRAYRDMYYHDAIVGSTVDIMSNLPWSDFTLNGVNDPQILKKYQDCCQDLRIKRLLPSLSVDYSVMGTFIGAMHFDNSKGYYTAIIPHDIDFCDIYPIPVFGTDPIIDLKFTRELRDTIRLAVKDPRFKAIVDEMPDWLVQGIDKGKVQMDPRNTIHIARKSFATNSTGVSQLRRIMPIYLLEKAIMRGTIIQAHRRQKSILHLMIGGDEWEASPEEMRAIGMEFMEADADPISSIVVTRPDIQANEVRSGQDFWGYESIAEVAAQLKMRGLGINDSLLSGDASYSTLDASISVMVEQIRSYRDMITSEIFDEKIFPAIAVANDFRKSNRRFQVTSKYDLDNRWSKLRLGFDGEVYARVDSRKVSYAAHKIDDINDYYVPVVNWFKQLTPSGDKDYLELLDGMENKGIPIPIRMRAAASGVDIDEIMDSVPEDLKLRGKIKEYIDNVRDEGGIVGDPENQPGADGGGGGFTGAGLAAIAALERIGEGSVKKIGFANRKFDGIMEPFEEVSGERRPASTRRKKAINEKMNRMTANILADRDQREVYEQNKRFKTSKSFSFSNMRDGGPYGDTRR